VPFPIKVAIIFPKSIQTHPPNPPTFRQRFSPRSKTLTDSANSECSRSGIRIALTTEAKKSRWACWVTFAKVEKMEKS
jgi:hypothetical protein